MLGAFATPAPSCDSGRIGSQQDTQNAEEARVVQLQRHAHVIAASERVLIRASRESDDDALEIPSAKPAELEEELDFLDDLFDD